MRGVCPERDVGFSAQDAGDLVKPIRHDFGNLFMIGNTHHCDQIDFAGDRIHLTDACQISDLPCHLRYSETSAWTNTMAVITASS